jgi:hypothetical protein
MTWEEKYRTEARILRTLVAGQRAAMLDWTRRKACLRQAVEDLTYRIGTGVISRFLLVASCPEAVAVASTVDQQTEHSPHGGPVTQGTRQWRIDDFDVRLDMAPPPGYLSWRDHLLIYEDGLWEYLATARAGETSMHLRLGRGAGGWLGHSSPTGNEACATDLGEPMTSENVAAIAEFVFARAESAVLRFMVLNRIPPQL